MKKHNRLNSEVRPAFIQVLIVLTLVSFMFIANLVDVVDDPMGLSMSSILIIAIFHLIPMILFILLITSASKAKNKKTRITINSLNILLVAIFIFVNIIALMAELH